jgi:ATP-dependent DNA helicase RecG
VRRRSGRYGEGALYCPASLAASLVLLSRACNLPYDAHGVRVATRDDLNLQRFQLEYLPATISPEALEQSHRTRDDQLRALRLVDRDDTPTVTALLLLGVEPRRWIPGVYIQFLRLAGPDLTDAMVDQREIAGSVSDQLRQIDELVGLHIARPATVGGVVRGEVPDYPEEALRQLIRNAVLHRTYEGSAAPVRVTWFEGPS